MIEMILNKNKNNKNKFQGWKAVNLDLIEFRLCCVLCQIIGEVLVSRRFQNPYLKKPVSKFNLN